MPTPTELGLLDAVRDLQARLDAPTREEWAIAGEILSPADYQALLEMSEDEQAEYMAMLVELWNEQNPRRYRQYDGILDAQPIEPEQDLLSGSLALAVLGAVWLWDRPQQRYLKPRGKVQGQTIEQVRQSAAVVDPPTVDELLEAHIELAQDDLSRLTDDLLNDRESLENWQLAVAERLRDLHYQTAMLAVGGRDGFNQVGVQTDLIAFIQQQYDYLRGFAMEIELGSQSPAQIKNRIRSYGRAARGLFEEFRLLSHESSNYTESQRFLGVTDRHCEDCVRYARMGRQPIGILPPPTVLCECRVNCLCRMEFYR